MADERNETEAQTRAREAGERAQSSAESGESGSMINEEPYSGSGEDGGMCTMTDGRPGTIFRTATGLVCRAEATAPEASSDSSEVEE